MEKIYKLKNNIIEKFHFLEKNGYLVTEICFKNLDGFELNGIDRPFASIVYANSKKRKITINLFDNAMTFVWIKNISNGKKYMYDHFRSFKGRIRLDHEYLEKKKSGQGIESYFDYYANDVKTCFENELKEVILGNAWIDVPFDWQGMREGKRGQSETCKQKACHEIQAWKIPRAGRSRISRYRNEIS